jgi:hypothetical protein
MKDIVEHFIKVCDQALFEEDKRVVLLLHECSRDKVQPPKDYWHERVKLQNKLKALRALLETI